MPTVPPGLVAIDALLALLATGLALWLRPWRMIGRGGPPGGWLVAWAALPLLWGLDRYLGMPEIMRPLSGAVLLVLLAGWPLAVLALLPAAAAVMLLGQLGWADALHRLVWLGLLPASLAVGVGAAVRRWLPHDLLFYLLGRAYVGTVLVAVGIGTLALAVEPLPAGARVGELVALRVLLAFGEASITVLLVTLLVAVRPDWLATFSERLYLRPH